MSTKRMLKGLVAATFTLSGLSRTKSSEGDQIHCDFEGEGEEDGTLRKFMFDSGGRKVNSFRSCSCRVLFFLCVLRRACVLLLHVQCFELHYFTLAIIHIHVVYPPSYDATSSH